MHTCIRKETEEQFSPRELLLLGTLPGKRVALCFQPRIRWFLHQWEFRMPVTHCGGGPGSYVYLPCAHCMEGNIWVTQQTTIEQKFFSSPSEGKQWAQFIWPHGMPYIPMNVFLKLGSNNHWFHKDVTRYSEKTVSCLLSLGNYKVCITNIELHKILKVPIILVVIINCLIIFRLSLSTNLEHLFSQVTNTLHFLEHSWENALFLLLYMLIWPFCNQK